MKKTGFSLAQLNNCLNLKTAFSHRELNKIKCLGGHYDSNQIERGNLFFARKGKKNDGHNYINQAIENGATAIVCEYIPENLVQDIPIAISNDITDSLGQYAKLTRQEYLQNIIFIAITGSNGKTTIKQLIVEVLKQKYTVCMNPGNYNNEFGVPLTLMNIPSKQEYQFAVIEMGARQLDNIDYLCRIVKPDISILSNIGNAHIEIFGSKEKQIQAKMEIFRLANTIILDQDSSLFNRFLKENKDKQVYTIASSKKTVQKTDKIPSNCLTTWSKQGTTSSFYCEQQQIDVNLPLLGNHNTHNACWAVAVGKLYAVENKQIKKALENIKIENARQEIIILENFTLIDDSYNSSPESTAALFQSVVEIKNFNSSYKILVLGDTLELGNQSEPYHQQLANWVDDLQINYLITCGQWAKLTGNCSKKVEQKKHFEGVNKIIKELKYIINNNKNTLPIFVILKASNSMNFSLITDYLKNNPL